VTELKPHFPLEPFAATAGGRSARILFIGEAWGESEAQVRKPLVGESGKELWRMLGEAWPEVAPEAHAKAADLFRYGPLAWIREREAWMAEAGIAYTNVFALRPQNNKIAELCASKKELPSWYSLPHLSQGQYVRPEYFGELERLEAEIDAIRPNLIVLLGNTACWAVLHETNIGQIRGTIRQSREIAGRTYKCLPTYHPAGVMRQWAWRPEVVGDLMKARVEGASPDITRPQRFVVVDPTLDEIDAWVEETLANPPALMGCDTETRAGTITMIGFARSRTEALLIPFAHMRPRAIGGYNYWPEAWQEERAREAAARLLASAIPKVFQNGMYDFQYLLREAFPLNACNEDTMLLHHAILPEMRKGLGYLGAAYTREPAWKLMRLMKADTEKRDE
jgi:uracil-DNA glycosylase